MAKNTYVLDTSVYLTNFHALYEYKNHDIVVPLKVLEEIDKHKNRQDSVGHQARNTIRELDRLREKGSLSKGVRLGKGKGILRVEGSSTSFLPEDLSPKVPDNMIISTALAERHDAAHNAPSRKVILVTRDINMRVICDSIGLKCESYDPEKAVQDRNELYSGYAEVEVDEEFLDRFYAGEVNNLPPEIIDGGFKYQPNEFIMLRAAGNEKKTALTRIFKSGKLEKVKESKRKICNVKTRNREQSFAMDLLLDPDVKVVTLVGKAGSGKTLCAIAAGLHQTIDEDKYRRLIVSRPIQPMGKDIGFLPGDINDKMLPWLAPIQDNLQTLLGDRAQLEEHMFQGTIEIEALTYIRGRSISDAYIIIDESQNLTMHELKTIITRVGENTKIVLTGDIEQIDNAFINDVTNGLTHAVEKFKHSELAGHVTLVKGERSAVATLAAKVL